MGVNRYSKPVEVGKLTLPTLKEQMIIPTAWDNAYANMDAGIQEMMQQTTFPTDVNADKWRQAYDPLEKTINRLSGDISTRNLSRSNLQDYTNLRRDWTAANAPTGTLGYIKQWEAQQQAHLANINDQYSNSKTWSQNALNNVYGRAADANKAGAWGPQGPLNYNSSAALPPDFDMNANMEHWDKIIRDNYDALDKTKFSYRDNVLNIMIREIQSNPALAQYMALEFGTSPDVGVSEDGKSYVINETSTDPDTGEKTINPASVWLANTVNKLEYGYTQSITPKEVTEVDNPYGTPMTALNDASQINADEPYAPTFNKFVDINKEHYNEVKTTEKKYVDSHRNTQQLLGTLGVSFWDLDTQGSKKTSYKEIREGYYGGAVPGTPVININGEVYSSARWTSDKYSIAIEKYNQEKANLKGQKPSDQFMVDLAKSVGVNDQSKFSSNDPILAARQLFSPKVQRSIAELYNSEQDYMESSMAAVNDRKASNEITKNILENLGEKQLRELKEVIADNAGTSWYQFTNPFFESAAAGREQVEENIKNDPDYLNFILGSFLTDPTAYDELLDRKLANTPGLNESVISGIKLEVADLREAIYDLMVNPEGELKEALDRSLGESVYNPIYFDLGDISNLPAKNKALQVSLEAMASDMGTNAGNWLSVDDSGMSLLNLLAGDGSIPSSYRIEVSDIDFATSPYYTTSMPVKVRATLIDTSGEEESIVGDNPDQTFTLQPSPSAPETISLVSNVFTSLVMNSVNASDPDSPSWKALQSYVDLTIPEIRRQSFYYDIQTNIDKSTGKQVDRKKRSFIVEVPVFSPNGNSSNYLAKIITESNGYVSIKLSKKGISAGESIDNVEWGNLQTKNSFNSIKNMIGLFQREYYKNN